MVNEVIGKFAVIRYTPDPTREEFINIGIVLHYPDVQYLEARITHSYARVKRIFGPASVEAIVHSSSLFEGNSDGNDATAPAFHDLDPSDHDALKKLERRFTHPVSLSDLRVCSLVFNGDRSAIDRQFDRFYARYVVEEEPRSVRRPFDQRMLRKRVRQTLTRQQLLNVRENVPIEGQHDTISVDFVVQNGRTHVVQPLSFDVGGDEERLRLAKLWAYNFADIGRVHDELDLNAVIYKPAQDTEHFDVSKAKAMFVDAGARVIDFDDLDDFAIKLSRNLL